MKMIASCQDVGCFSSEFSLLAYSAGLDLQKQTFAQRVARIGNLPMLRVIKKRYPQDLQHSWVTMDLFKSAIASKDFATVKFILDLMVEQTIGVAIEYAAISGTVPILKTLILKRPAVWAGLSPNTITDISHNFVKNACSMGEVMDETLDMIGFLFQAAYGINSTSEFVTSLFQMSLQGAKKCTRQSDQTVIPAYLLKKFREMNVILVQETAIVQAAISTGSRRVLHLFLKAGWRLPGTKHEYDGLFSLVLENGDGRMLRFLMEHYSPFGDAGEALKRMVTARATSRLPILDSCAAKFLLKENIIEFSKEVTSARFKQDPMFL